MSIIMLLATKDFQKSIFLNKPVSRFAWRSKEELNWVKMQALMLHLEDEQLEIKQD